MTVVLLTEHTLRRVLDHIFEDDTERRLATALCELEGHDPDDLVCINDDTALIRYWEYYKADAARLLAAGETPSEAPITPTPVSNPTVLHGLHAAGDGWQEYFAWYPVKACGRWRWLGWVQRRRDLSRGIHSSYLESEWPWEYRAGRMHDYPDSTLGEPLHFHPYDCKHCGAKFTL